MATPETRPARRQGDQGRRGRRGRRKRRGRPGGPWRAGSSVIHRPSCCRHVEDASPGSLVQITSVRGAQGHMSAHRGCRGWSGPRGIRLSSVLPALTLDRASCLLDGQPAMVIQVTPHVPLCHELTASITLVRYHVKEVSSSLWLHPPFLHIPIKGCVHARCKARAHPVRHAFRIQARLSFPPTVLLIAVFVLGRDVISTESKTHELVLDLWVVCSPKCLI
mmetsp:Transcript_52309/g.97936  ORF Transcript_52309/g.97936 Transcript_52309/m.97936 type:complete len:221 (-) Transcript_52309:588-1250(-)